MTKGQKWGFGIGMVLLAAAAVTLGIMYAKEKKQTAMLKGDGATPPITPVVSTPVAAAAAAATAVTEAAAAKRTASRFSAVAN